jgi:hypothetical protein
MSASSGQVLSSLIIRNADGLGEQKPAAAARDLTFAPSLGGLVVVARRSAIVFRAWAVFRARELRKQPTHLRGGLQLVRGCGFPLAGILAKGFWRSVPRHEHGHEETAG